VTKPSSRLSLQTKAILALLAIAGAPLVASVILVRQVAVVAQSVAVGEAERLHGALDRAREAYVEAARARKSAFQHAAEEVAERPALRKACLGRASDADIDALLAAELDLDPALAQAALALPGRMVRRARPAPVSEALRLTADRPLREAPSCAVELTYQTEAGAALAADFQDLGEALRAHRQLERIRRDLPPSYQLAFVVVVGGFALATTLVAILFARRVARRIDRLVAATRRVAEGDLETRVADAGKDELGDLARAFDDMVGELAIQKEQIEYLQKIGAWQEVARRLAHEIKNPLTPIQLAVQELHKTYRGEDPRYQKTLDDSRDIVEEEIAGLRRLVDAFSGFAKLPRVEPRPLDLAVVVEDVVREQRDLEPEVTLTIAAPAAPVMILGDRMLLRRVLVNLVENARQAGAHAVTLAWSAEGENARLTVDDDGSGVPPELAVKIFDPYVTTKPHGTGLGLAIVKKTILEHGGTIELLPSPKSETGARFEIRLRVAVSERDAPGDPSRPA
jgi:two-component system, NtrC family, nitrogen regulation sensor histidine kinase NtrY